MNINKYEDKVSTELCQPRNLTLRERLIEQKISAEENLSHLVKALEFLDKNPDFESFHNIIGKVRF